MGDTIALPCTHCNGRVAYNADMVDENGNPQTEPECRKCCDERYESIEAFDI